MDYSYSKATELKEDDVVIGYQYQGSDRCGFEPFPRIVTDYTKLTNDDGNLPDVHLVTFKDSPEGPRAFSNVEYFLVIEGNAALLGL